jgi:hypothetical protein
MPTAIPREYNPRDHFIAFCWLHVPDDPMSPTQFVKVVADENPLDTYGSIDEWVMLKAPSLWAAKYGTDLTTLGAYLPFEGMPSDDAPLVESGWAETIMAGAHIFDAPSPLTDAETSFLRSMAGRTIADVSLADLWIMMTVADWRPGMITRGIMPTSDEAERLCAFYREGGKAMDPMDDMNLETTILGALDLAGASNPLELGMSLLPKLEDWLHET